MLTYSRLSTALPSSIVSLVRYNDSYIIINYIYVEGTDVRMFILERQVYMNEHSTTYVVQLMEAYIMKNELLFRLGYAYISGKRL
jgi:hypothetical protein